MGSAQADDKLEEGAPVPEGKIDPDLVKLRRSRTKVGIITSAGVLGLCIYFLLRLSPDRHFAGEGDKPRAVALSDVIAGNVATDDYIELEVDPLMSQAVRSVKTKGDLGLRVVPIRGTNDRLWLALPGDGWAEPVTTSRYAGRLRRLGDLPLGRSVKDYVARTPRAMFATAAAVRAGLATGKIKLVTGDEITLDDSQQVAFDVVDPNAAQLVVSFTELVPDMKSWGGALRRAEIDGAKPGTPKPNDEAIGQGRWDIPLSPELTTKKLEAAELYAARVEAVTLHRAGTWGELKKSGADAFTLGGATTPDAQVDIVGVFVTQPVPDDAYALVTGELPKDYWYVLPITIGLVLIGLLFGWALVRAVRRDLLPARA
jgi:hypothetical protein